MLGLVVRTNQIQLRIDAVQGPGNLLGNLLCGITGILNPSGAIANTPLGQLDADPQRAARALAAHRLADSNRCIHARIPGPDPGIRAGCKMRSVG